MPDVSVRIECSCYFLFTSTGTSLSICGSSWQDHLGSVSTLCAYALQLLLLFLPSSFKESKLFRDIAVSCLVCVSEYALSVTCRFISASFSFVFRTDNIKPSFLFPLRRTPLSTRWCKLFCSLYRLDLRRGDGMKVRFVYFEEQVPVAKSKRREGGGAGGVEGNAGSGQEGDEDHIFRGGALNPWDTPKTSPGDVEKEDEEDKPLFCVETAAW